MGDANSPAPQRHHSAVFQCLSLVKHDFGKESNTLLGGDIRQAQQSGMRDLIEIDQLAKVGIEGNQNPALGLRELQQGSVPGILAKFTSIKNIVSVVS